MGTFLKYLVYLLILIVLYIVARGLYSGSINSSTTVGEVATQVDDGARTMARDTVNAVSNAVEKK